MDRRDTIKSLLIGSLAGGLTLTHCAPESAEVTEPAPVKPGGGYGRTPGEQKVDEMLNSSEFFTSEELATIAVLSDLILPATSNAGGALDAEVPAFIEFMAKDLPSHQLPLRGGLMWLDNHSNKKFNIVFRDCGTDQQKEILDEIAYPDKADPALSQGVRFFSLMRNLVLTGYYTTRMGLDDLGYKGNAPNVWDGVPEEVLKKHDVGYDEEWLAKCIDQEKRMEVARWDEDGNLLN